jgi:hypothetical protein
VKIILKVAMKEIISFPDGTEYGFGYEELRAIKIHNPNCFDSNFYCTNDKLKEFLKKYMYLSKENFDYDTINKKVL